MTTNKCGATGAVVIGDHHVGQVTCDREIGHDVEFRIVDGWTKPTPHRVTLEWFDVTELPDLALFDPDEIFDVEVPAACVEEHCVLASDHTGLHDEAPWLDAEPAP